MSQFKRFNSSDNTNWNTNDAYPAGTLTWDPDNGLRVHDGNTSGGNSVGGTGYTRFLGRGIGSYNNGAVYDMTISPNWDGDFTGYSYINIPSNENFGSPLQIVQNNTGGVQIITENNATWEFKADGDLVLPSEGGIVRYNGEGYSSVLFSGDYNDLINKPDVSDLTDTTGLLGGGGSGVSLPTNAVGVLSNDGSGTLSWATLPSDISDFTDNTNLLSGGGGVSLPPNGAGVLKNDGNGTLIWATLDIQDLNDSGNLLNFTQAQADWEELNAISPSYIQNKPTLVTSYLSLTDTPTNVSTFNNDAGYLTGTPWTNEGYLTSIDMPVNVSAFANDANYLTSITTSSSGAGEISYSAGLLTYTGPELSPVATSGSYNDLSGTPTIPTDISDLTDNTNLLSGGGTTFDQDLNTTSNVTFNNITFPDSTVQSTAWTGILPDPTYSGSNAIGNVTPAPLNLNNTGTSGELKTQLTLINTAGSGNTGSAIDFFTYTVAGNGLPGARLQSIDDGDYSADFSIVLKENGNGGNGSLTTAWTFGADGNLTLPGDLTLTQATSITFPTTQALEWDSTIKQESREAGQRFGLVVDGERDVTIKSQQGQFTWLFDNDGTLHLPASVGDIKRDGTSVLGGGGTSLPTNASGYLNNDGSGTLTWVPGNPSGAGALPYNEVVVFSNTVVGDWTAYTLSGTMDAFYDWNNGYATITLSSEPAYGKQITPNTKRLWINDAKIDNNDYIVIEFPASPAVGDVFTVPMVSPTTIVNAGSFVIGETYTIVSTGTTSWTSIGSSYGGAGQSFVATGQGYGTGTASTSAGAKKVIFKPASGQRAQTMAQGNLVAVVFGQGGDYDFMYIDLSGQNSGNPVTWVYAGVIDSIPTWYQFYF